MIIIVKKLTLSVTLFYLPFSTLPSSGWDSSSILGFSPTLTVTCPVRLPTAAIYLHSLYIFSQRTIKWKKGLLAMQAKIQKNIGKKQVLVKPEMEI